MSHFRLLRQPPSYQPSGLDLFNDAPLRTRWLDLFARQFENAVSHAIGQYGRLAQKKADDARQRFLPLLDGLRDDPTAVPSGRINVIELDHLREAALRDSGLKDPYAQAKAHENTVAAEQYLRVVHDLHALDGADRWLRTVRGVLAGNLAWDVGAASTMDDPRQEDDFGSALERIRPRPWAIDDFDVFAEAMLSGPPAKWTKAVVFVDNSGPDVILGMLPLARELALAGTIVVLAANESPSLNDVTVDELIEIVDYLAGQDPDLPALIRGGMIEFVSTGSGIPLLDLSDVSDELNEAAADADLVLLEGMARAVESNWDAEFTVDAIRLAVLKDPEIAARIGAEEFDCVLKYTPGPAPPAAEAEDEQGEAPADAKE